MRRVLLTLALLAAAAGQAARFARLGRHAVEVRVADGYGGRRVARLAVRVLRR